MFTLTTKNTTVLGIVMILTALLSGLNAMFDGDPTTNLDFGSIIAAITGGWALIKAEITPPKVP